MSRAFVKGADEEPDDDLPERPLSPHPNYVTPAGHAQLQARVHDLQQARDRLSAEEDDPLAKQKLREVKRDLRYFQARLDSAIRVNGAAQPRDEVHFGAVVAVGCEDGQRREFSIVGEDEADVVSGKISWASPLGKSMIGSKVGDTVVWQRPAGETELEIVSIRYPESR